MKIDSFLTHYQLQENPFGAEEARHDPIFDRLADAGTSHPDFPKILGRLDKPGTAVVFGEKGSGKTAMRLLIGKAIAEHNYDHPDRRVLVVPYDDFNPLLDRLLRTRKQKADDLLNSLRLVDHQDAILSHAVTRVVGAILGQQRDPDEPVLMPEDHERVLRRMPRQNRVDLAVLAALYDQPQTGSALVRWRQLRRKLGLHWQMPLAWAQYGALALTIIVAGLAVAWRWMGNDTPLWLLVALGLCGAGMLLLWGWWAWRHLTLWRTTRRIRHEMPAVARGHSELRDMLANLRAGDLTHQPLPEAMRGEAASDSRYQLTRRLVDLLGRLGYVGIIVLVDRVDEPTFVSGDAAKMKSLVWPMFDNKFLQQNGVGIKLLLPVELRHALHRESAQFFQEARLDKQNLIDRLTWSGTTLYDLCSTRLRAVRPKDAEPLNLTDLFEQDVTRETLIDALDQMHQPRDAFKFLYWVIQEHCRMVPEEQPQFKIARLTLESVRRMQSQRVQELYRGLAPA